MATLPVPASTEPVADAAKHINALADAINAAITSKSVAYFTGVIVTNASSDFLVPGITGVLSTCSGAFVSSNSATPYLFSFGGAGEPGVAWIRAYSRTGAPLGAAALDVCVIAYGTPA